MDSTHVHAFLEFFLPVLCTIFFPSHWLLNLVKTGERGINLAAVTIIKPFPNKPGFYMSAKELFRKNCGKRRNCL